MGVVTLEVAGVDEIRMQMDLFTKSYEKKVINFGMKSIRSHYARNQ